MPDTNWPADLERRESEQSGEPPPLMDQIVAICRAGHERALRTMAEPHETIECLFCGEVHAGDCTDVPSGESYSTWRERTRDRADCERDRGPGKW